MQLNYDDDDAVDDEVGGDVWMFSTCDMCQKK